MKSFTSLALVVLMAAAAVAQQTPRTPPTPAEIAAHRVAFLTSLLTLTSAQQAQATTIFTNAATQEQSLRDSMKTAHEALQTAVKANNAAGIDSAANTIGNLTTQSISTQSKADAAFYAILTPDQQTKLNASHHGRGGFGPGPGGMGMMGGGRMGRRNPPPPGPQQ